MKWIIAVVSVVLLFTGCASTEDPVVSFKVCGRDIAANTSSIIKADGNSWGFIGDCGPGVPVEWQAPEETWLIVKMPDGKVIVNQHKFVLGAGERIVETYATEGDKKPVATNKFFIIPSRKLCLEEGLNRNKLIREAKEKGYKP